MEKTPTQYLHRSGWGERIALLLLSLVLVAFPVYRMYIEKEITFKYILLLVLALLVIAFLCRSFKVDEFGITVYWFALFPQLIPWKSIRRIEYHSFENLNGRIGKINYPIVMNEGGAKSRLWRKIITDVFAQPTVLLKNRVGAPYGDCLLAAKAVGAISDYSIAKAKAEYVEPMEPDMKLHDMYMDYYQLFNSLYDNLKDEFVKLSNLRNKYSEI